MDLADAEFFGQPEPMYERLILGHIVGGGEVDLQHVLQLVAFGRGEDVASPKPVRILEPSKCIRQWVSPALVAGTGSRPSRLRSRPPPVI